MVPPRGTFYAGRLRSAAAAAAAERIDANPDAATSNGAQRTPLERARRGGNGAHGRALAGIDRSRARRGSER